MSAAQRSEGQNLAEAMDLLFTSDIPGWFTPFTAVLEDLTAAQASTVPAERFNSVWGVVNHVRFFQEVALHQLKGLPVDNAALGSPEGTGWTPLADPTDEAAWQAAKDCLIEANRALVQYVASLTTADLDQPISDNARWNTRRHLVQSMIAHNSYHTCEVISIRHMQGLWFNAL